MDNKNRKKSNSRQTSGKRSSAKKDTDKGYKNRSTSNTGKKQDKRTAVRKKRFITGEISGILLMLFGILLFLSNFSLLGSFGDIVSDFMGDLFGKGAYVVPVSLIAAVLVYLKERGNYLCAFKVISVIVISFIFSAICQLTASDGGTVGVFLADGLTYILGKVGAYLIVIALLIICGVIITEKSFLAATQKGAKLTETAVKKGAQLTADAARNGYGKISEIHNENKIRRDMRREEERLKRLEESFEWDIEQQKREKENKAMENMYASASDYDASDNESLGNEEQERFSYGPLFADSINADEYLKKYIDENDTKQETYSQKDDRTLGNNLGRIDIEGAKNSGYAVSSTTAVAAEVPESVISMEVLNKTRGPEVAGIGFDMSFDTASEDIPEILKDKDMGSEDIMYSENASTADTDMENLTDSDPENADLTDSKTEKITDNTKSVQKGIQKSTEKTEEKPKPYVFPPVSLLRKGQKSATGSKQDIRETAEKLEKVLSEFGVGVTVSNVIRGPRVTRFEMIPDVGVKVSRITALEGDIKLALAATGIRIEAPIPGKSAVGIEVPNSENMAVSFRDILESPEFRESGSKLTWGVGMDIQGRPVICDIAKMPHLLIGGTTGSGKSVGINTLIMSILYTATPEEVRLILIDPKIVELSGYNGIPHLLADVVTKPDRALATLNWAVAEMNNRYKLFKETNTRNISGYNEKIEAVTQTLPEGEEKPKKLPYILIIIDELSELMMHSKKDIEGCIVSLTQLARAAGIHLVVATQRPDVSVVTGLIKSNIPGRVAYKLPSATDSRTIIDHGGADKLLGNGDMLYKPSDKNDPERIQGAFLSDGEIEAVISFLKKHNSKMHEPEGNEKTNENAGSQIEMFVTDNTQSDSDRDEYFADAGRLIIATKKASIGALQRKFKLGFNRAARIMDQLFEAGVVSDSEGTKERQILMTPEEFEELLKR